MIDHLFIPLLGLFLIALLLCYSTGYLPTRMRWHFERWRQRRTDIRFLKALQRRIDKSEQEYAEQEALFHAYPPYECHCAYCERTFGAAREARDASL